MTRSVPSSQHLALCVAKRTIPKCRTRHDIKIAYAEVDFVCCQLVSECMPRKTMPFVQSSTRNRSFTTPFQGSQAQVPSYKNTVFVSHMKLLVASYMYSCTKTQSPESIQGLDQQMLKQVLSQLPLHLSKGLRILYG